MRTAPDGRPRGHGALPDRPGVVAIAGGAALAVPAAVGVAVLGWQPASALALIAAALLVIGGGLRLRRRARERRLARALGAWGRERGLMLVEEHGNPGSTALLRRVGRLGPALLGPLGGDPGALIGLCRTRADGRDDPHGAPFTVAVLRVAAIPGLAVRLGAHEPALAAAVDDWRPLATESAEVDERWTIEVRDGHDPVRVRDLLAPDVIAALAAEDPDVGIEIEAGSLVVWLRGHVGVRGGPPVADGLERLRAAAERWGGRVRDAAG